MQFSQPGGQKEIGVVINSKELMQDGNSESPAGIFMLQSRQTDRDRPEYRHPVMVTEEFLPEATGITLDFQSNITEWIRQYDLHYSQPSELKSK